MTVVNEPPNLVSGVIEAHDEKYARSFAWNRNRVVPQGVVRFYARGRRSIVPANFVVGLVITFDLLCSAGFPIIPVKFVVGLAAWLRRLGAGVRDLGWLYFVRALEFGCRS
jgi:hypothetical protein